MKDDRDKFKCERCGGQKDLDHMRFPYDIFDKKSAVKWCQKCFEKHLDEATPSASQASVSGIPDSTASSTTQEKK